VQDTRLRRMGMLREGSVLLLGGYAGASYRELMKDSDTLHCGRESAKNLRKIIQARAPELQVLTVIEIKALAPTLLDKIEHDRAALSISKNMKRDGCYIVKVTYFGPEKEIKKILSNKIKAKLSKKLAQAFGQDQVQISLKGQETLAKELAVEEDLDDDSKSQESSALVGDDQPKGHRRRVSDFLTEKEHGISSRDLLSFVQKRVAPSFTDDVYDSLREDVQSILAVSTKLILIENHKTKGVLLQCGDAEEPEKPHVAVLRQTQDAATTRDDECSSSSEASETTKDGYGLTLIPLKVVDGEGIFVDNPIIAILANYARFQKVSTTDIVEPELPELILGLCVNNWGMYSGRHALLEALLEVLGPTQRHKLSIHTAAYAKYFNTDVLRHLLPSADFDAEERVRLFHADAFEETAMQHNIGFDTVQEDHGRFGDGTSKAAVVAELTNATMTAVAKASQEQICKVVLEILTLRRLLQDNIGTKGFRRRPIQNKIKDAIASLLELLVANFGNPTLKCTTKLPGWGDFVDSQGGVAIAVMALYCHSIDVLAGSVGRSDADVSETLAAGIVEAIVTPSNRMMEYCFNQIYELTPVPEKPRMYIYRGLEDLKLFSNMPCGVIEMGGKL